MAVRTRGSGRRGRIRGFGYFSRLGPAFVTGAADDDPSGIGTYSQVGAAFGFGLLWMSVVTLPLAAAVQELAARLGLATGHGLSTSIARRYSRRVLLGAVALVATANVFNIGADLGAIIAILGTTISPYLFFWQASEEVEEEEQEGVEPGSLLARRHVQAMRGDVAAGMASAVLVMFAIMVSSASTLHVAGVTTVQTAAQAASALGPVAGRFASLLFALGIIGTGMLAGSRARGAAPR